MEVVATSDTDVTIIAISGRLWGEPEGENLTKLLTDLKQKGIRKIVIDMEGVALINSSGLGSLIAGMKGFREVGGDTKLANLNESIQTILKITRLNQIFHSYDSREDAVASF